MRKLIGGSRVVQGLFVKNSSDLKNPPVDPAVFLNQINDLDTADQAMKTNKNAGPARKLKVDAVWGTLEKYLQFVQELCDQDPEKASYYIAAAGFQEIPVNVAPLVVLTAEPTNVPGQVQLKIHTEFLVTPKNKPFAKRTHLVRHSLDGGKTLVTDDPTSTSHTLVDGLPPDVVIQFEVAAKDASGVSPWCTPVRIKLPK